MADKSYQVLAPYVTLKVKDVNGVFIVSGYYAGGVVSSEIEAESLKHHLDSGMIREVSVDDGVVKSDPEEDFATFGSGGAGAPEISNTLPTTEDLIGGGDEAPAASDKKNVWVDYAEKQDGAPPREELEAMTKAELVEKYGA